VPEAVQAERSGDAAAPARPESTAARPTPVPARIAPRGGVFLAGPQAMLGLQRLVGNAAVTGLVEPSLQRVGVTAEFHETLYNQENAGKASAPPGGFTGGTPDTVNNPTNSSYEMTRAADNSGATVLIKIRFMQQARNTVPPPSPNPTGLPEVGQLIGPVTEIPADDASGRRAWATDVANRAVTTWNNQRVKFVTQDHGDPDAPAPADAGVPAGAGSGSHAGPGPTELRLPVTFQAQAVFAAGGEAHQQVIVHPPSTVPGTAGNPIDAGNWYRQDDDPAKRAAAYPATDDVIYAHEYGHMLGIPDEYSQSNEQLNTLIHGAAPGGAASARAALDRTTIERMALAAMANPLYSALQAAIPSLVGSFAAKRAAVTGKLATAARQGVLTPEVRGELESELRAASDARTGAGVPRSVAFQTTTNFSNSSIAGAAVSRSFSAAGLGTIIGDAYWQALLAPHSVPVAVAGFDSVTINMSSGMFNAAGAGTGITAPAAAVATGSVGTTPTPAAGGGGAGGGGAAAGGGAAGGGAAAGPGLPPIPAPADLVTQLSGLPATWSAAGSQLETSVTPAAFSTAMTAGLRSAAAASAAAAAAALPAGAAPAGPSLTSATALYRKAYQLVSNSAGAAARQVVGDLVRATIGPTLASSIGRVQADINAEVTRISTTPPAGMAAAGPADPNMASIVAAMKTRLDADKAATAGTGRDPTAGGGAAPDQDVSYSAQGLMGSSATTTVRGDQFLPMVTAFNNQLRHAPREDAFTVKVG